MEYNSIDKLPSRDLHFTLCCLVSKIEDATLKGVYVMGIFVNAEVVFDCGTFQKLCDAVKEHNVDDIFVKWMYAMPTKRLLCVEGYVDPYLTQRKTTSKEVYYRQFCGGCWSTHCYVNWKICQYTFKFTWRRWLLIETSKRCRDAYQVALSWLTVDVSWIFSKFK